MAAYQNVFELLDAEGITTVAASGNFGPDGCGSPPSGKSQPDLGQEIPGALPYVLSIGGTAISGASPLAAETALNGPGTASQDAGGGLSSTVCMPRYQSDHSVPDRSPVAIPGLLSANSVRTQACVSRNDPKGYRREVPDLSADAAKSSPYLVYYQGKWTAFYGTAASTALIAGETALIDASPYCSSSGWRSGYIGMSPGVLYKLVSVFGWRTVLRDIKTGSSHSNGPNGHYPARAGYDEATGLGAPLLAGIGNASDTKAGLALGMAWGMCFAAAAIPRT
jgi:subtilase family serine protease